MDRRTELHEELCTLLGSRNVYFQPPSTVKMKYPCLVYQRDSSNDRFADNGRYLHRWGYSLTYITYDPDDPLVDEIPRHFQYCRWNRHYTADNLNHDAYSLAY